MNKIGFKVHQNFKITTFSDIIFHMCLYCNNKYETAFHPFCIKPFPIFFKSMNDDVARCNIFKNMAYHFIERQLCRMHAMRFSLRDSRQSVVLFANHLVFHTQRSCRRRSVVPYARNPVRTTLRRGKQIAWIRRQDCRVVRTGLFPYGTTPRRLKPRRVEGTALRACDTTFQRRQKRPKSVQA